MNGEYLILVGQRLREIRKEKGLNQSAVSEHLNLSTPEGYGHYERGDREMSFLQLVKFCQLTGANAEWILTGVGPKYQGRKKDAIDIALDSAISRLGRKRVVLLDVANALEKSDSGVDHE